MYMVNANPAPWLMLCSLGSAPLDATRVLACLLALHFSVLAMLSFSSFSAHWILVIMRAVVFKGKEGDQCPFCSVLCKMSAHSVSFHVLLGGMLDRVGI
jgi:hypothetical protein